MTRKPQHPEAQEPMVSIPASVAIAALRSIEQDQIVRTYLSLAQCVERSLAPPVTQPEPEAEGKSK
jgi:hypothetical protein